MDFPELENVLPATTVKRRFLELLSRVGREGAAITITKNGVPAGVLVSADEYEALLETVEILADENAVRRLARARRGFAGGRTLSHDEVWRGE